MKLAFKRKSGRNEMLIDANVSTSNWDKVIIKSKFVLNI